MVRSAGALLIGLLIVISAVLMQPAAPAAAYGAWADCNLNHPAGHQWTTHFYNGSYGWFYTYQPDVLFINNYFSNTHLYLYTNNYSTFMEVGWYRGVGAPGAGPAINTTQSRYYTAHADFGLSDYWEDDLAVAPSATYVAYEAQYDHFDYGTNKYEWNLFANNMTTRVNPVPYQSAYMPAGITISGAEASAASGIELLSSVIPSHQLKINGGWNNWNDAYMAASGDSTQTCTDPNITLAYNGRFDNYTVGGRKQ